MEIEEIEQPQITDSKEIRNKLLKQTAAYQDFNKSQRLFHTCINKKFD
jgi:hypothetical protein